MRIRIIIKNKRKPRKIKASAMNETRGNRTRDNLIKSQVLYRLS